MEKLIALITDPFNAFFNTVILKLPSILGALILLLIGLIVSRVVRELLDRFFVNIKLDSIIAKTGLTNILERIGLGTSISRIIAVLVYWFILLIFIVSASNAVGLNAVSDFIKRVFDFIPVLVSSIVILAAGFYLAGVVKNIVLNSLTANKVRYASGIASGSEFFIYILSVYLALTNIIPRFEIIGYIILIAFGAVAAAFAISFGIAGKDFAAEVLKKLFK